MKTFHDSIIEVEVFLKLDNIAHHIKDKVVEIKVHIPKHTLFIKEESKTFEESCEAAFDAMFQQLKKAKDKALL
jgi:putative sigma-54 modulation protein